MKVLARTIFSILILVLFVSCTNKQDEANELGTGVLELKVSSDLGDIDIFTKVSNPEVSDDYLIRITNSEGAVLASDVYSAFKSQIILPAGSGHIITAQNISGADALSLRGGRGSLHLFGSSVFDIIPLELTTVNFGCLVANHRVSVEYTDAFKSMYSDVAVVMYENSSPERSISFDKNAVTDDATTWGYFNIDSDPVVVINISATRNDGVVQNFQKSVSVAPAAWSKVTVNASFVGGQAGLDITQDLEPISQDYNVPINPDGVNLVLRLPAQSVSGIWATYFLPNLPVISDVETPENSDIVFQNLIYELSADATDEQAAQAYGGGTWFTLDDINGVKLFNNLEPNTSYVFRIRYHNIVSPIFRFTTDPATQLPNQSMEDWTEDYQGRAKYANTPINIYYPNSDKDAGLWKTHNASTASGAASISESTTLNVATMWRFDSTVKPSTDASDGSKSAELSTKGFYNAKVGITGWSRTQVYNYGMDNRSLVIGRLFFDQMENAARPTSFTFDYKYAAYPANVDKFTASVTLYNTQREIIGVAQTTLGDASDYTKAVVDFIYSKPDQKASYMSLDVKSGTGTDYLTYTRRIDGSHNATPFPDDRIYGSVLKIDNIVFTYEYKK